ncbi:MAG: hypothetical protein HOP30_07650 [Cyclobacteriaceae bacterium]|nr:hypothetical protein [Cyclobacteriaceae bacterium]
MSKEWLFHPLISPWFICLGAIALLSGLLWLEWKRPAKFLYARMFSTTLLVIALAGVLLQPHIRKEITTDGLVVLTLNYNDAQADSLRKSDNALRFVQTPDAKPFTNATTLTLHQLQHEKNIRWVLGDGLPEYFIEENNQSYRYLKSKTPFGIIEWNQPEIFRVNHKEIISGKINSDKSAKLILSGPGGVEDSITVSGKGIQSFQFSITPKQEGKFVYSLHVKDENTTEDYPVPVEAKTIEPLRILMIQRFPSAEMRYLKNFLIIQGHRLAVRTQLSKNNFNYEYSGIKALKTDRLTGALLQSFDVVIIPSETLVELPVTELNALTAAVENGLGLIKLIDGSEKKNRSSLTLAIQENAKDTVRLKFNGSTEVVSVAPWIVKEPVEKITDANGRTLSGFAEKGIGKSGFQFLQETYQLILKGKEDHYAELWSPLLEQMARTKNQLHKINIKNSFPIYPDEPIEIAIISAENKTPRLRFNQVAIPMREDVVVDDYRHGKVWADTTGWQSLAIEGDSISKNFYVAPIESWASLRTIHLLETNERISSNSSTSTTYNTTSEEQQIPPLFFFLLFLGAAGFLWLAPKL